MVLDQRVRHAVPPDHGGHALLVDEEGAVVEGDGIVNRAAYAIHSRVHAARPHVNASVHMHPTAGLAWASLGRTLAPITQDACAFYQDHEVYDAYKGPVLDLAEVRRSVGRSAPARRSSCRTTGC